jgi:hypothetical protein
MSVGNFVDKVGVEIEGFYYTFPGFNGHNVINKYSLVYDGSIKIDGKKASHDCSFPSGINHPNSVLEKFAEFQKQSGSTHPIQSYFRVGEVVSEPLNSNAAVIQFLRECWPDKSNKTSALHFHLSFKKIGYYSCLMEEKFGIEFRERLQKFAVENNLNKIIQSRIFNKCEHSQYYCRDRFIPLNQVFVKQKVWHDNSPDRYTILNFCFGLHKTMECRVFSSHTNIKAGLACWKWLFNTVEDYLKNNYEEFISSNEQESQFNLEVEDSFNKQQEEKEDNFIVIV